MDQWTIRATALGLAVGTDTVTVTSANGCFATATASITEFSTPMANISASANSRSGTANGSATVSVTGGAMPYQYLWNNGQNTATAINLAAGTYTVTVIGNNGCTDVKLRQQ
ncbi:MAG: SprB repeat-containing protein [Lewinellaceae bacterium]|nr:SprB repeat-containing protein [Lewinellaceae bacterium]